MPAYALRLWLPDRPGALGAVASRVGAVRGDVVAIDILERGAGRALDELIIELPSTDLLSLLLSEIAEVDGVEVEDVRPIDDGPHDARLDALETAALLVEARTVEDLLRDLASHARQDFEGEWAVVVDPESAVALTSVGAAPPAAWLGAFVAGSRSSVQVTTGEFGPDDVAWAPLPAAGLALVLGRRHRPFRLRERQQAAALARIANSRWVELATKSSRVVHPTGPV